MKPAIDRLPKLLGFAAFSGTGKTTLLTQVIPLLVQQGKRLAIIKHSHHDFEIDRPGKDSYELHHAGSTQTLITSKYRHALISENISQQEVTLEQALSQLDLGDIDLVLVEGFRDDPTLPCIVCHRSSLNKPPLFNTAEKVIAIACDTPLESTIKQLDINSPAQVATFIIDWSRE